MDGKRAAGRWERVEPGFCFGEDEEEPGMDDRHHVHLDPAELGVLGYGHRFVFSSDGLAGIWIA